MAEVEVGGQFTLDKIIHEYFKLFMLELNFALPAVVEAVNPSKQTVDVKPTLMKRYESGKNVERAIIRNVQFQFPRGGDSCITLPIKPGDEGLLVFSCRDISSWKNSGGVQPLHSTRLLDYNDAVFIPGVSSYPRAISEYDADNITIIKNGKKITVKDGELDAPDYHINCKSIYASDTIEALNTITSATDVVAGGISGKTHVHGGVASGPYDTGIPK